MAGGLLCSKYPEAVAKSLEMVEKDAIGPARVELPIPIADGIYIGAVMMNRDTLERIDISARKSGANALACQVPKGNWKVMLFYLDPAFCRQSTKVVLWTISMRGPWISSLP